MEEASPGKRQDLVAALALATALTFGWTVSDWTNLAQLRLPDTDDAMRLQQVRDWLAGQAFGDVAQHRLGTGDVPLHWSRLADFGPAALILGGTPLLGEAAAERLAVIVWPGLLFAMSLWLVARIARHVSVGAGTAAVIAALAYPATAVFLPGRIDHHGLQIVLLLTALLATLRPARARGVVAGTAIASSLVVGLETAPLLATLGVVVAARWIRGDAGARDLLAGIGLGALGGLTIGRAVFATDGWTYPACDGFTAQAWRAALPFAAAALGLGLMRLETPARRCAAAVIVAIIASAAAFALSPGCLSPYGQVDARLRTGWLDHVGEAQSLLVADPAAVIGYLGVLTAGTVATAWRVRRRPDMAWITLLVVQAATIALAFVQLRAAQSGAMLAAPGLAALVAAARVRGGLRLAGAWLASAGMLYPIAANALGSRSVRPTTPACDPGAALALLAARPSGLVLAPIDWGAWGIAATHHRFVAAPYHRNTAGNLAALGMMQDPNSVAAGARTWHVDYVLRCGGAPLPGFRLVARSADGATLWQPVDGGRSR